jgi:hypothetical protein
MFCLQNFRLPKGAASLRTLIGVFISLMLVGSVAAAATHPVPSIDVPLSPNKTVPGHASLLLTVRGSGFDLASVVNWNGSALTTNHPSLDELTAVVPAADLVSAGSAFVTVANPAPGGGTSNVVLFQIAQQLPRTIFESLPRLHLNAEPEALITADFNHDGKLDMATVTGPNGTVSILLGNGDNTFQPAVDYSNIGLSGDATSIVAGDFNGDGNSDLAVGTGDGLSSGGVYVLLGNGDGTFQAPTVVQNAHGSISALAAGDFNGDGKLDIVAGYGEGDSGFLSVALGRGDGTFRAFIDHAAGVHNTSIVLGDFNHDGKLDVAAADSLGSDASVLLGNGDGTFAAPMVFDGDDLFPSGLAAADFNGDGNLDLALSLNFGVSIFLGHGDGTFGGGTNYACGSQPLTPSLASGDFNGDGKVDLVLPCNGNVSLLYGNGDGSFAPPVLTSLSGTFPQALTTGDFSRDGLLDVVVALAAGNIGVTVFPQATLSVTPAAGVFFPNTAVGSSSGPRQITLRNFGATTISLGSITLTGTNPGDFSLLNACGSSLGSRQSCTVGVTFQPTTTGVREAAVSIVNQTTGASVTVNVAGKGI